MVRDLTLHVLILNICGHGQFLQRRDFYQQIRFSSSLFIFSPSLSADTLERLIPRKKPRIPPRKEIDEKSPEVIDYTLCVA